MSDVHAFDEQIDRLADEFEAAWKAGAPPQIAAYLPRIAEAGRGELLAELVHLDMEYRRRLGQPRQWPQYAAEFSQLADATEDADTPGSSANDRGESGIPLASDQPPGQPAPHPSHQSPSTGPTANPDGAPVPIAYPHIDGFRIIGPLGEGGMGTVYKAIQLSTRREVALKLMSARSFGSRRAAQRFHREVELAAKLEHPHIATILEAGLHKGIYYYAMRLVRGLPLHRHVESRQLDRRGILDLMLIVCQAVGQAHEKGIIHRDLKPNNIMVDETHGPFVLDFGLAKAMGEHETDVSTTHEGDVVGTPAYMSPEQAAGRVHEIDTRSDVYALGVMLYMLLTGRHPVDLTGSRYEVLTRIVQEKIKPLREVTRDLDPKLEVLVMKALKKDRGQRYKDARELAGAIKAYLSPAEAASAAPPAPSRAPKTRAMPIAAVVAMLIALLTFILWPRGENELSPPLPPPVKPQPVVAIGDTITAANGWVDLLPLVDVAEDAVQGAWRRVADAIEVRETMGGKDWTHDCLRLPVRCDGGYELLIEATRQTGDEAAWVQLLTPRSQCYLAFGGWGNKEWGLRMVGGVASLEHKTPGTVETGRRNVIAIRVETIGDNVRITATHDGRPRLDWSGPQEKLYQEWQKKSLGMHLGLGAVENTTWTFHRVALRVLSGSAILQRPPSSIATQAWPPGPAENVLPGLLPRPAALPNVKRWNLQTRRPRGGSKQGPTQLAFDAIGARLLVSHDGDAARIYEMPTLRLAQVIPGVWFRAAWSPDGRWIALTQRPAEELVDIWSVQPLARRHSIKAHDKPTNRLAWSPDSTLLATGGYHGDGVTRVWNLDGKMAREIKLQQSADSTQSLHWSRANLLLAGSESFAHIYPPEGNAPAVTLEMNDLAAMLVFSPDDKWIAGGGCPASTNRQLVTLWDAATGKIHATLQGHQSFVNAQAWSPDSARLASAGQDGWVHIFDIKAKRQVTKWKFDDKIIPVNSLAWSRDGKWIAAMDEAGQVGVFSGETYEPLPAIIKPIDQPIQPVQPEPPAPGEPITIVIDAAANRIAHFSPAGKFLGKDATILDEFVYVVEEADGSYTTLEYDAFIRRVVGKAGAGLDLRRGLVAHWTFDDGEGVTAADASGHGHHGKLMNVNPRTAWVKDNLPIVPGGEKNRAALRFDGNGSRVDGDKLGDWGSTRMKTGTMAFWILTDMTQAVRPVASVGPRGDGFNLWLNGPGDGSGGKAVYFNIRTGRDNARDWILRTPLGQPFSVSDGKWHHIAILWDAIGDKGNLYCDGAQIGSNVYRESPFTASDFSDLADPVILGGRTEAKTPFFTGLLDDIRIYDRMLSDEEIKALAGGAAGAK